MNVCRRKPLRVFQTPAKGNMSRELEQVKHERHNLYQKEDGNCQKAILNEKKRGEQAGEKMSATF